MKICDDHNGQINLCAKQKYEDTVIDCLGYFPLSTCYLVGHHDRYINLKNKTTKNQKEQKTKKSLKNKKTKQKKKIPTKKKQKNKQNNNRKQK